MRLFLGKYEKEEVERLIKESSIRKTAKKLGCSHEAIRKYLREGNKTKPVASGSIAPTNVARKQLVGKRFVFTAAQNNTYVHEGFLSSVQTFCKYHRAALVVSRFTYNKSGFTNDSKDSVDELWYDDRLAGYFRDEPLRVARDLLFCGELDILPTAADPISGLENYCGSNSGIIPHVKVAMKSLPRMKNYDPRFIYTTGAITQRNYIQRKAGQKAEFHHVFGALYVEIDEDGDWFARQLIADEDGSFYDLRRHYNGNSNSDADVLAINWGDIHVEKEDKKVSDASWGRNKDSLLYYLRPQYQFIHDLTDFNSRNHHEIKNPYTMAKRYFDKEDKVERDLQLSVAFLARLSCMGVVVVVASNHHDAYYKWVRDASVVHDPLNARFWHESNARVYQAIEEKDKTFNLYKWALSRYNSLTNVVFLQEDESYVLAGVEFGVHGHLGINGAIGTPRSFRTIGTRVNTGHTHSAGIIEGVYTAGVSADLDMGYNRGPSSWSNTHILTYRNGKRALITIKRGKWHG